jgi:LacI family transcriptional regulator
VFRQADLRGDLFPFASFDGARGALLATRHLIAMNARGIAFVGGEADCAATVERMSGYLDALSATAMTPLHLPGPATRAFGAGMAERLRRDHPEIDAAICFDDQIGLGMLSGFARMGRKVGTEFRIVGFEDIRECDQAWPRLSSVACDSVQFGRDAAVALLDWVETGQRPPMMRRAPVALIARDSSLGVEPEGSVP